MMTALSRMAGMKALQAHNMACLLVNLMYEAHIMTCMIVCKHRRCHDNESQLCQPHCSLLLTLHWQTACSPVYALFLDSHLTFSALKQGAMALRTR